MHCPERYRMNKGGIVDHLARPQHAIWYPMIGKDVVHDPDRAMLPPPLAPVTVPGSTKPGAPREGFACLLCQKAKDRNRIFAQELGVQSHIASKYVCGVSCDARN